MYQTLDVDLWPLLGSTFDIVCNVDCKDIPHLSGLPNGRHKLDDGWVIFSNPAKELSYFLQSMLCRRKVAISRSNGSAIRSLGEVHWQTTINYTWAGSNICLNAKV